MIVRCWILLRMINISDTIFRENQNTFHAQFTFFPENRAVFWDSVQKCGKAGQAIDDNVIWRMHFAYWITQATHTEYMLISLPRQRWLRERASLFHINTSLILQFLLQGTIYNKCTSTSNSSINLDLLRCKRRLLTGFVQPWTYTAICRLTKQKVTL